MKKLILAVYLSIILTPPAVKASPCESTLCLFGLVTGQGGGDSCSAAIAEFFAIKVVSGMFGSFDPIATRLQRKAFLGQCDSGVESQIDQIISKFGEVE